MQRRNLRSVCILCNRDWAQLPGWMLQTLLHASGSIYRPDPGAAVLEFQVRFPGGNHENHHDHLGHSLLFFSVLGEVRMAQDVSPKHCTTHELPNPNQELYSSEYTGKNSNYQKRAFLAIHCCHRWNALQQTSALLNRSYPIMGKGWFASHTSVVLFLSFQRAA